VRLTERHVKSDPPSPAELEAVRQDVRVALQSVPAALSAMREASTAPTLVGVAGTVTSLAAIAGRVDPYDAAKVHGALLSREKLASLVAQLAASTTEARKGIPGLSPKRADVIVAGAVVCEEVAAWARADAMTVSDRGVRWGLARRLLAAP
jgi:exopolyphosphatase/guanosine-5'-triphosphate,3'-diphosphate pyrophosphatase